MSASVATADEVEALITRLARLEAEVAELRASRGDGREVYSPREIAKRLKLRLSVVHEACRSGALACDKRPHKNGVAYQITIADASRWRAAVGNTNQ